MARIDRTAFAKALHEAHEREHDQRWQDAIDVYADVLASLGPSADTERRAMRAIALMRRGNALMELRRWDEARGALDEALHDAKASGDRAILAQALLAAGVFAANRDDHERAEAFLLDALERFHRDEAPASLQGRGWAFLNLATLYGKTGRLDLAFVTFTKAQDVLGVAEDWGGVAAAWEAQAQLRRAIHDEDRWREDLGEAIVFYDREGMKAKADRLRALLGRKLVCIVPRRPLADAGSKGPEGLRDTPDLDDPLVSDSVEMPVIRYQNGVLLEARGRMDHVSDIGRRHILGAQLDISRGDADEARAVQEGTREPRRGLGSKRLRVPEEFLRPVLVAHECDILRSQQSDEKAERRGLPPRVLDSRHKGVRVNQECSSRLSGCGHSRPPGSCARAPPHPCRRVPFPNEPQSRRRPISRAPLGRAHRS